MPTDWLSKQQILGKQKTTDREKRVVKGLLPACKSNISLAGAAIAPSVKGLGAFPLPQPKATPAAEICPNSVVEKLCKTPRSSPKTIVVHGC